VRYFENSEKKYQDYEINKNQEIRRKNILYSSISENKYFDFRENED